MIEAMVQAGARNRSEHNKEIDQLNGNFFEIRQKMIDERVDEQNAH